MELVPDRPELPRKLVWLAGSLDRLAGFPPPVRHSLGFALYLAQIGQKDETAKMLHGFGETVWQVCAGGPAGTYRADPAAAQVDAQGRCREGGLKVATREYTVRSGNVFADLGLPKPDDLLAKAELAAKIIAEIQRRRLTQSQASQILGIDQPKVSALKPRTG